MMRSLLAFVSVLALLPTKAQSESHNKPTQTVLIPSQPHATAAGTLYLNRCVGGCTIYKSGLNDARTRQSTIPQGDATEYTLTEFAWGDEVWNDIVQCVKEVYSPYDVVITDQPPAPGVPYNEAIIAGTDDEVGRSAGGIAPVTGDCMPYNYTINFTFANDYAPSQVFQICAVAAQESGHSYGLDHTFAFIDGTSGCRDPMTYRGDCGGQKFFRNEMAICGEYSERDCACGKNQNSHLKLVSALGPGLPITRPPEVTVTTPAPDSTIAAGQQVIATASAQRGIKTVELWLNGYLWGTARGAAWGRDGQPESAYGIRIPDEVPDGVIDIVVKAKDDIDVTTTAPTVTVTKGAPCTSADTCLDGQRCDAGRCLWDPPSGDLGDPCTYPQFCLSGVCVETSGGEFCSQKCLPGVGDSCPDDLTCEESAPGQGFCFSGEAMCDGGCCGCAIVDTRVVGAGTGSALTVLFLGGVGFLVFRRRRR
ncbi:MAG: Ig-like domain-containing protein [Kofleriaceae bacterium]|nr:Ig-like domain-containing protein [Kofleriaceae bacterium]